MAEATKSIVLTESLTKIYLRKSIALHCLNLDVAQGTVLGVLGANGAGKTTLVKLLLGLHVPTAGRVYIQGRRMTPNAAVLRRHIGYMPADLKFPPQMTPIDYLDYVGRLGAMDYRRRRPRLAALLQAVDLIRQAGEPIRRFSAGMRTRLALAASLINDPELLIWDEPSQGLDPEARRSMVQLMKSLGESKTLILCSHNLQDVEEVCNRAIVLHEGKMIFHGELEQLRGQLRPSDIEILVAGDRREIAESIKVLQAVKDLENVSLQKNLLRIKIKESASHATTLANVLTALASRKLEVADLRTNGQATELAISHLTHQEGSRGLTRAYQPADG